MRQFENEYNPVHWHSGHISGAGFLKVPSSLGKHIQDKGEKPYLGGRLTLIHGTRQFLSNAKLISQCFKIINAIQPRNKDQY